MIFIKKDRAYPNHYKDALLHTLLYAANNINVWFPRNTEEFNGIWLHNSLLDCAHTVGVLKWAS